MLRRVRALLALAVLAACHGDGPTLPPGGTYTLTPVTTAASSGPAGSRLLAIPLVTVVDAAGEPASGVIVALSVVSGPNGLALPETATTSGPDGIVRADVQLGAPGSGEIRVRYQGVTPAEATTTVTAAAAPTLSSVSPVTFGPGDEVQLAGSGLTTSAGGTQVYVGGVRATILESSTSLLRVRAPACVADGQVALTVNVGGSVTTNALQVTYASSAVQPSLQPFEGVTVPAARAGQCLSLLGAGARYLVVPQYATREDVPSALKAQMPGFTLGAPAATATAQLAAGLAESQPPTTQERFDRALRMRERELVPAGAASGAHPPVDAPPLSALALGSTRTFRVLSTLDPNNSSFVTVTARLRFVGEDILIYVDEQAPANGLSDSQVDGLGRLFDRKLYPADVQTFGAETDIDQNDHVAVLLTPVVNKLTSAAACSQSGYVTGFFYGADLVPSQANSNRGEIFYALVPDATGGTGSCAHSVDEILRIVPSTFIHELQHMISWGQHVLVRSGNDEELWLNEGLSHIAEELGSLLYERDPTQPRGTSAQLFPDSAQGFILGDITSAYDYLSRSTATSLTLFTSDGTLEERGAAWLFLRWLGDQKGDGIYRRLVETKLTGVANIEDKAGEPFSRLFGDFGVALYSVDRLSTTPAGSVPARYRFLSRNLRQIFQRLYDTNTPGVTRPFPIVPGALPYNGSVANAMKPGTMTWYQLNTGASDGRVRVSMTPASGADFNSQLGAQVTIFRLP